MNVPRLRRFVALFACSLLLALTALLLTTVVLQRNSAVSAGLTRAIPADEPTRGLIFAGLATATDGPCRGGYLLPLSGLCTHGPDTAPAGVDVPTQGAPAATAAQAVPELACEGDGTSGNRTQVIYARPSNNANGDRYATYLPPLPSAGRRVGHHLRCERGRDRRQSACPFRHRGRLHPLGFARRSLDERCRHIR